jgi:hypothetical protein
MSRGRQPVDITAAARRPCLQAVGGDALKGPFVLLGFKGSSALSVQLVAKPVF